MDEPYKPSPLVFFLSKWFFALTAAPMMHFVRYDKFPREPSIVLGKHSSYREVLQLSYFVHSMTGKIPLIAMKATLKPYLGWWGGIPVDRGQDKSEDRAATNNRAFERMINGFKEGRSLILFPEGHRNWGTMGNTMTRGLSSLIQACNKEGYFPKVALIGHKKHGELRSEFYVGEPITYNGPKSIDRRLIKSRLAELSKLEIEVDEKSA